MFDAFLEFEGAKELKGESVDANHPDAIEVLSWSWGMSQMGTTHRGTGGGAGRADVSDLVIVHRVDAATPNLMRFCCKGTHIEKAILTVRKAGDDPLEYLVLTMEKCLISSVQPAGSSGSEEITESFSINFAKFTVAYQPQDEKGQKKGGAIEGSYDISKNE